MFIYKDLSERFKHLLDTIEAVGFMANPEMGEKIVNDRRQATVKKDLDEGKDELQQFIEEIKDVMPENIVVNFHDDKKTKFFLPKYERNKNRSVGIEMKDDGE